MNHREVLSRIDAMDDAEVTVHGKRESAGQHYYEIGIKTDASGTVATRLKQAVEGTDWRVSTYDSPGGPYAYDHETETETPSNMRVKKNLYNDHMM